MGFRRRIGGRDAGRVQHGGQAAGHERAPIEVAADRSADTVPNRDPDAQAPWLATPQPAVDRSEPDRALALAFAKDGSIWLTEWPGRVRVTRAGQLLADPAITISVVTANGCEDGLLGIAVEEPYESYS